MVATAVLDVPVSFGSVSIGKKTAKVSMKIERNEDLNIVAAEEAFCGRRLSGIIKLGGKDDSPGQKKFIETDTVLEGTFDVHRMGVTLEEFSIGATFAKSEIDVAMLGDFSSGSGRVIINDIAVIPVDVVEEDDEPAAGHLPGSFKADGPWKKHPLDQLFSGAILKSLKKAGLDTVGDLNEYQQPSKSGFTAQLKDISGIGAAKVETIENTMINFWADNPQD